MGSEDQRISYESWNSLIFGYFFGESQSQRNVSFSVENDVLAAVSGLPQDEAEESFRKAVLSLVSNSWSMRIVSGKVKSWEKVPKEERGIYPAVAFLAITVLAASKMGEDELVDSGLSSANFYVPLRRTLNPIDDTKGAPNGYREHIEYLWNQFAKWMNEDLAGTLGYIRLTQPPPERRYVELSTQHAILRASDRRRLDDFFEYLELRENQLPIPEIKRHLVSWCRRRNHNWAQRISKILEDPNLEIYSNEILKHEISEYLEESHFSTGGQISGRIRLLLDFDFDTYEPELNLILAASTRHPSKLRSGDEMALVKEPSSKWFLPIISDEDRVREAFSNGFSIRIEDCNFSFDCEQSYLFAFDSTLNAWVSRPRAELGLLHCLMVVESRLEEVMNFLEMVCAEEFKSEVSFNRFPTGKPGFGWVIIRNIRINVKFDSPIPLFLLDNFSFTTGFRLKIHGGLPIGHVTNTFLVNGEPTVSLSDSDDRKILSVESNVFGVREISVENSQGDVDLWSLNLRHDPEQIGMDEGIYEISDGYTKVRIEIAGAIVEEAGPGADELCAESIEGSTVKGTYSDLASFNSDPIELSVLYGPAIVNYDDGSSDRVIPPLWLTKKTYLGPLSWDTVDYWPQRNHVVSNIVELDRSNKVPMPEIGEIIESGPTIHTAGDELLRWVSEVGSGSWEQLKQTSKYLMDRHKLNRRDSVLGSNLSKLGHLEIDWLNSRWAVVKPTINVIPGMGLIVVLTGSRPQIVEDKFESAAGDSMDVFALPLHFQSIENPHSRMLKCASLAEAKDIAAKLGARVVVDPASRLAGSMKSLDKIQPVEATEPHKNEFEAIKVFNCAANSWQLISRLKSFKWTDGLFEAPGWGRPRFLIRRDGRWYQLEKSHGLFMEYQRVGRTNVMQYKSQNETQPSYLYLDSDVVLPMLAERALVMCSGFAAKSINTKTAYINVPKDLAIYIANKLGQKI